ncbi:MAG: serine hydrolase [Candidatus Binataceae bacterium]
MGSSLDAKPPCKFTARELIRRSQAPYQVPQYTNPGGDWQYSHTNFVMLGSIPQKVTGRKYGTLVSDLITKPRGLQNTIFPSTPKVQKPVLHAFTSERGVYDVNRSVCPSRSPENGKIFALVGGTFLRNKDSVIQIALTYCQSSVTF